ncbi:putative head morphogenesis protein [uncultured Caudovirales phage]|uniref:Putative head morphogenesis protein n=1 Tax=uncultured Caudovirales phage TaxID=2100421 RepID=A0A2H4J048_9CAUD|nr:putative head morphogenesis protein [uncultured Caudovirales phage]
MHLYEKRIRRARKEFLDLNLKQERELLRIYQELAKQLSSEIASCRTSSSEQYLREMEDLVQTYMNELNSKLNNVIKSNIKSSSQISSTTSLAYYESITDDVRLKTMFNKSVVNTSANTVKKLIQGKYYEDGKTLDQRIWNITRKNAKDIDTLIKVNVARGANARELAKQVDKYVHPLKRTDAKTIVSGMSSKVSYQAQRLARTSISHSFAETTIENSKNNPFNLGIKWNLSDSHYVRQVKRWGKDICDKHATQNDYKLGTGVFPLDRCPIQHPNCLCYLTEENLDIDEAIKELKEWTNGKVNTSLDEWYENNQDKDIAEQDKKEPKPKEVKWSDFKTKENQFKNKKEIKSYIKENYDIEFSDSTKYPIHKDLLQDSVNWLDKFHNYFEGFKEINPVKLPKFKIKAGIDPVGYYSYYPNRPEAVELVLNGLYFTDKNSNIEYVESCIKSGWTVANAKGHKTFVHEYGHHVADSLKWLDKEENKISQDWCKQFIDNVIEDYNKQYNKDISFKDISTVVGRYGGSKPVEAFAETFAEAFGGENPREFAQVFRDKVEKKLNYHIKRKKG